MQMQSLTFSERREERKWDGGSAEKKKMQSRGRVIRDERKYRERRLGVVEGDTNEKKKKKQEPRRDCAIWAINIYNVFIRLC